MSKRIEIRSIVFDTRADALRRRLIAEGFIVDSLHLADAYTIDKSFTQKQFRDIAGLFINPIVQVEGKLSQFTWAIEIGFLPGVTDNVATTAREMITDYLGKPFVDSEGVYTSRIVYIDGNISRRKVQQIANSLYNPVIQRVTIEDFQSSRRAAMFIPRVKLSGAASTEEVDIHSLSDGELEKLGSRGIHGPLALDLSSMKTIQWHFRKLRRNPTDIELESIAQTWSEHCKHTIMNSPIDDIAEGLFKKYIRGATQEICRDPKKKKFCVSVFTDNSGAIEFDTNHCITHKVETHNSPSALDPYGGAITGIVGVNRDCLGFGLGAKPIMNTFGFCLGYPGDTRSLYRDSQLQQPMLTPRRIFDGVVAGVNSGGNCSGIPTPTGFVYFDDHYKGKPLVFVGTVGFIPKSVRGKKAYLKNAQPGDFIVMIGGRVGLDGIHGATFSSEALTSGSPVTAVQIGDPITQKKLSDAIVKEARDKELYTSITDNGAGGLSCSVAEMAKEAGGCLVNLENVPLKYPGLNPWQIWISESQERMTLAVPPKKWKTFHTLMQKRGVEATVIGTFTRNSTCIVRYKGKTIMNIDMKFLHNGMPVKHLKTSPIKKISSKSKPMNGNVSAQFLKLLTHPNISGFSFISQQFDHEVQGTSVLKPLQGRGRVNGDAAILHPILTSDRGIVASHALYPEYGDIDAYYMAACAIDTAIRNAIVAGANPDRIALLDNFCWCDATNPKRLWQLKRAALACYDYAVAYGTPFISGKDSMFNDFHGFDETGKKVTISVPPTLLISSIGIISNIKNAVSLDAKNPGDLVYVLGSAHEVESEHGVNAKTNTKLYRTMATCIERELIASAQSVHHGGLAAAIAKTTIGGQLGIDITIDSSKQLFEESQGRILVTIAPQKKKQFEKMLPGADYIGIVTENEKIIIRNHNHKNLVDVTLKVATSSYRSTFQDF